jgi:hypothetical protein
MVKPPKNDESIKCMKRLACRPDRAKKTNVKKCETITTYV